MLGSGHAARLMRDGPPSNHDIHYHPFEFGSFDAVVSVAVRRILFRHTLRWTKPSEPTERRPAQHLCCVFDRGRSETLRRC